MEKGEVDSNEYNLEAGNSKKLIRKQRTQKKSMANKTKDNKKKFFKNNCDKKNPNNDIGPLLDRTCIIFKINMKMAEVFNKYFHSIYEKRSSSHMMRKRKHFPFQ